MANRFLKLLGKSGGGGGGSVDASDVTGITDNQIVRGDNNTGIQGSDITVSDPAASVVTLSSSSGNTLDIGTAGAQNVRIMPNAGAVGGWAVLGANGAFAQSSGNAGTVVLPFLTPSATVPAFTFLTDENTGIGRAGADQLSLIAGGAEVARLTNAPALLDVAGMIQSNGFARVATNQTNDTTTPASTTLSVTLAAGRTYKFRCVMFVAEDVAAEGVRIDFDGGSATMTAFRAHTKIIDAALVASSQTTALATDITAATITGDSIIEVEGAMVVDQAGTFIPRFAQNTHTTGTVTLYALSNLIVFDMP